MNNLLINVANHIVEWVQNLNILLFLFSGASSFIFIVGRRMENFTKPDARHLSPLLRMLGKCAKYLGAVFFILGLLPFIAVYAMGYVVSFISEIWTLVSMPIVVYAIGAILGCASAFYLTIVLFPKWEKGPGLDDIHSLIKRFSGHKKYNPLRYVNIKEGCFIGKTEDKPLYIPWHKLHETHVQVMGGTGAGKGLAMSLIAYQCILNKESIIFIDPKFDRYAPRILRDAASKADKPFVFINLNPQQPPQINLLSNASRQDIEEILISGFDLAGKGTDGDYYRGKDQDAALVAAKLAESNGICSFAQLVRACSVLTCITDQDNFWRCLRKIADLPSINASINIDLATAIKNGSVIYVVGSVDNERVKTAQKMLLVRIMQLIKRRDRFNNNQPVCVVLDEFKHLLTPVAINALGTVRDFDAHFLLAHQSLGDLRECTGIDPAAAYSAVVDNTAIKIIYHICDGDYAEKISKMCGVKRTFVETVSKSNNGQNDNFANGWHETQAYLIPPDFICHMPVPSDHQDQAAVGVLVGNGIGKIFSVAPITTSGPMPDVVEAEPCTACDVTSTEELI